MCPHFPKQEGGGNCNSEDDALGPPISTAMSVGQLAVELYVYQVPTNVPNGVVVKNAADVLAQAAAEELGGGVIAFEIAPPDFGEGFPWRVPWGAGCSVSVHALLGGTDAVLGGMDGPTMAFNMVHGGRESPRDQPETPQMAPRRDGPGGHRDAPRGFQEAPPSPLGRARGARVHCFACNHVKKVLLRRPDAPRLSMRPKGRPKTVSGASQRARKRPKTPSERPKRFPESL